MHLITRIFLFLLLCLPSFGQNVVRNPVTTNTAPAVVTFSSATNSLPLFPYVVFYLLQSATPTFQTNATGAVAGFVYAADLVVSNSTAAAFTNRFGPSWIARGYAATNAVATLGIQGAVVPAVGELFVHVETYGVFQTNFWLSY